MAATEHLPSPNAEDIMAYLDGEGTEAWRASIEAHLATCEPCQTLAAEQQHLSASLGAWHVDAAPASLRVPAAAQRPRPQGLPQRLAGRRWRRVGLVGLSAAATVVLGLSLSQGSRFTEAGRSPGDADLTSGAPMPSSTSAGNLPEPVSSFVGGEASTLDRAYERSASRDSQAGQFAQMQKAAPAAAARQESLRQPSVIRTASLRIVARDFSGVRSAVEAIVAEAGGFIDQMTATGDAGAARRLRGTLRVPSDRLADAAGRLRGLGQVIEDTQGSVDVTDQLVDLDVRLSGARATELRLTELLRTRTGKLSDVLDIERELARVRIDIERLNAQSTNVGRQVSYATLSIDISEERKAGIDPGPLSLASRLRVAAADGLEAALETVVWTVLTLVRVGPQVVLWMLLLGVAWLIVRRRIGPRLRDVWMHGGAE